MKIVIVILVLGVCSAKRLQMKDCKPKISKVIDYQCGVLWYCYAAASNVEMLDFFSCQRKATGLTDFSKRMKGMCPDDKPLCHHAPAIPIKVISIEDIANVRKCLQFALQTKDPHCGIAPDCVYDAENKVRAHNEECKRIQFKQSGFLEIRKGKCPTNQFQCSRENALHIYSIEKPMDGYKMY